ncbi:MAG: hypothetical protein OEW67_09800 [Cyclobacteriaceae bacterium]|nr:hypothetical protein [Cyclobacteriaceae bacterium]
MDNSTEDVTLITAFINDVIELYDSRNSFQSKLKEIASGYDLSDPMNHVPIQVYNDMCAKIENEIGLINTKRLGRKIGERAYKTMLKMELITENCEPIEMMEALKEVASVVIIDPKKRGWEITDKGENYIIMRRTQTFNRSLQFGILDELIRKTFVYNPVITYYKSIEKGDEYDEYKISWTKA